jgi:hypothetical protein
MKITKSQLRKLIKESLNELSNPEAAQAELGAWMKKKLTDLPVPPISALSPDALELSTLADPEHDGSQEDDAIIKGGIRGAIPFSGLKASQNEVGAAQSLRNTMAGINGMEWDGIHWGDIKYLIQQMATESPTFEFKNPIVVAKTSDGFVVLDGHHRWSQAMMINPNGKINAVGFDASGMTADNVLQALHLGIYKVTRNLKPPGQAKTKAAKGGNLFTAGPGLIMTKLKETAPEARVNPETLKLDPEGIPPYVAAVMRTSKPPITDVAEGYAAAEAYAKKAIQSIAASVVDGAPARTKMPQTDVKVNPGATPKAVGDEIEAGDVNYAPPYIKGATPGAAPGAGKRIATEAKTYARWKKILKGWQ